MTEILAPAGDEKSAYAAIDAGADAVYLGLTAFSARSSAANFGFEELEKLISYAHLFGVKIYVAMNTLVKDAELESFVKTAVRVHNLGADALIVQDIYLGAYLKETYPQMCLHLSTQAGVCNAYGAKYAKEMGFSRVILARETPLKDIAEIAKIIETETFVQGALCTCFSGQCYLSSFAGGNSGNRGKCKQPCRKKYSIDREGFQTPAYRLSLADLSVGEDIKALIAAGVTSFKIEGRMRRPEYVSAAVGYYKKILSGGNAEKEFCALKRTYNRGNYTKGLIFGQDKSLISSAVQGHIGEYVGTVTVVNSKYFCRAETPCAEGDGFKILRGGSELCGAVYGGAAKGGFYLKSSVRLKNGDKVFITTDVRTNSALLEKKRVFGVNLSAEIKVGEPPKVALNGIGFTADFIAEKANGRPIGGQDIITCFEKTDKYPFAVTYRDINVGENAFVPVSLLNAFRRRVYLEFYKRLTSGTNIKIEEILPLPEAPKPCANNGKTCVIASDLNGVKADLGVLKPTDYSAGLKESARTFNGVKFLYLPPYLTGDEIEKLKPVIALFDGVYCNGYYAAPLAKELNKKLFAGVGFNIFNHISLSKCEGEYIALSKELTISEAKPLARENTFYLTSGAIQVMDLIYCPFGRVCKSCDRRSSYVLTDENKREFILRRYSLGGFCRFEIFNCAELNLTNTFTGALSERTVSVNGTTKGHGEKPVL